MPKFLVEALLRFDDWPEVYAPSPEAAISFIRETDLPLEIQGTPHHFGALKTRKGYRVYLFNSYVRNYVDADTPDDAVARSGLSKFLEKSMVYIYLVDGEVVKKSDEHMYVEQGQ